MPGSYEQLFAEVGHLTGTESEKAEHSLHQLSGVRVNSLLVNPDDIRQERQRLYLCGYKVHKGLFVE